MSSSSSNVFSLVHHYLVTQPTIFNFSWSPTQTPLSSLPFLVSIILTYLSLTLLLTLTPITLPPPLFRLLSALHNTTLLLLSLTMAAATSLSALLHLPSPSHLFCFPLQSTTPSGPLFFWAYVFYLSKLYELLDTLLILLNPNPIRRRPTFLHVYHHSVVIVMCYLWLATRQSLMPLALVTNASVHVVMYAYYLSSSLGMRWPPRWKRAVTRVQIWQFVVSFSLSVVFLWMHFVGDGCEGMKGWLFNAVFNASLLALFLNFHARAYSGGGGGGEKRRD